MSLEITTEVAGDTAVIKAAGDCDCYTAPDLRSTLLRFDAEGYSRFLLDLTACTYLDATGLGVITGALKRARHKGGSVAIACDSEPILKVFRVTGLTKVFGIFPTRDEAVAAMAGDAR